MYESHTTIISSTEKSTLIPAIVKVTPQLVPIRFYTLSASVQNLIIWLWNLIKVLNF